LIDTCRDRIKDGYLRAGYLDAEVNVLDDEADDRLAVAISEGSPYVAGKIRVTGDVAVAGDDLVTRLRQATPEREWIYLRGKNEPLNSLGAESEAGVWIAGEPARCDAQSLDALARRIDLHLADMGFPFARFQVRPDPAKQPGTLDLLIQIEDAGKPAVLGNIETKGLTRHTQQQLLQFLNVRPGMTIDAAECQRICQALRESCRFWRHAVYVRYSADPEEQLAANPQTVELGLSLEEYDRVPNLDQPLPEVDQCLVRAAEWMRQYWTSDSEEDLVVWTAKPLVEGKESTWAMRIVVSRRHGCPIDARGEDRGFRYDAAAICAPKHLSLFDWRSEKKLSGEGIGFPQFTLTIAGQGREGDEYRSQLNMKAGVRSVSEDEEPPASPWTAEVEPVAIVNFAHRKDARTVIEDGVLTVANDLGELRIEAATGRILNWSMNSAEGSGSVAFRRGEFERMRQEIESRSADLTEMFNPEAKLRSLAAFALESALTQPCIRNQPSLEALGFRFRAHFEQGGDDPLTTAVANYWPGSLDNGRPERGKFVIPPYPVKFASDWGMDEVLRCGPAIADALFPRDSWPWTLARESSFLAADGFQSGDLFSKAAAQDLWRTFADPNTGPVGQWIILQIARSQGSTDDFLAKLANKALQKWDAADVSHDIELLTRGDHGLVRLTRAAVEIYGDLPDADRSLLANYLPEPWSGMSQRLIARRAAHPDETPEQAVEAVLQEAWQTGYSDFLKSDLRKLAGVADEPAIEVADRPEAPNP
jgi:hypothetical protein